MPQITVKIEPPEVEEEDLEDLLATDGLFIEYFNTFLALPTFPEPLCFNKNTGGFEIVTDAKKELAKQIKAAVRSAKRTPKIYRVTKNHSFSDIPLIPIEEDTEPEKREINTSFTVQTLNKEQGIHWIKRERLPAFLDSECYVLYRLSKVLCEVQLSGNTGEYVTIKIDHTPRPRKRRKREMTPPPEVDESDSLLKNCFVCMGNASTTDTDAWVSQAKIAHDTNVTVSGEIRPSSATTFLKSPRRPTSGRPVSAFSSVDSYRNTDSGLGMSSPSKLGSIYGSGYHIEGIPDVNNEDDLDDEIQSSKLFDQSSKPNTPRPSDVVCYIDENASNYRGRGPSFYTNKSNNESQGRPGDVEGQSSSETKSVGRSDDEDSSFSELPRSESPDSVISLDPGAFQDIDEYTDVVVATILKYSFASAIGKDPARIAQLPQIKKLFPSERYIDTTKERLKEIYVEAKSVPFLHQTPKQSDTVCNDGNTNQGNNQLVTTAQSTNVKDEKEKKPLKTKDSGYDSEDSLLGSDDDYEESDTIFRKNKKQKPVGLNTKKGIEEFRKFLKGTQGEKNLNLWLDIDRGRLLPIDDQEEIQMYLAAMRDRYFKHGSVMELSQTVKLALKLTRPECWTLENLFYVQDKIAEPLVCYWAPRFLLKQTVQHHPEKNTLYHHQKLLQTNTNDPYPNPPTVTLLPLRPKSCAPRCTPIDTNAVTAPQPVQNEPVSGPIIQSKTSPLVGLKRVYSIPEHFHPYIPSISKAKKELVNSQESEEASGNKTKKKKVPTATLR